MYGGGGNAAADARKLETERQARIKQGMGQINATFNGTRGANLATTYTPGTKYYDEFGQEWTPPAPTYRAHGAQRQTPEQMTQAAYESAIKAGKLYTGTESSGGFDDAFYDQRAKDVESYEMPQFADQYKGTRNTVAAALARRGLLNSGAAIKTQTSLDKYAGTKRREIADAGLTAANQLRSNVEDAKSQLVSQLVASGDPSTVSASALTQAAALRKPTAMPALGNLFSDWVSTWQANQNARSYDPSVQPLFSFGTPGGGRSSQRIVGG